MKRTLLTLLAALALLPALADEGMWLPSLISERIDDMRAKGFRLTAEDIYSINKASMKDAVVLFNGGCTGELISPEGLLLTNHHCGYDAIQKHSTVEHDYLTNGFWAMSRAEELPNEKLWVRFLVRMEEVTDRIAAGETAAQIVEKAKAEGTGYKASVEQMYYGNQQFLFVYEQFDDVRLVAAPPSSIGKFGGDTDNWMWPRHTGDFSVFRVYAGPDNRPADYSPENRPYKAEKFLKISLGGYDEGDFAMIMGFPGSTQRYMTSYEIDRLLEVENPQRIFIRGERQAILKEDMAASAKVRIQYASKYAQSSNYWKNSIGKSRGIRRLDVKGRKQEQEAAFTAWAAKNTLPTEGYSNALNLIHESVEETAPYFASSQYLSEAIGRSVEILVPARLAVSKKGGELTEALKAFYKDYNMPTDRRVAKRMFRIVGENCMELPSVFAEVIGKRFGGDTDAYVDYLYDNSVFADERKALAAAAAGTDVSNDPAVLLNKSYTAKMRELAAAQLAGKRKFADGQRLYIAGLMRMQPNKAWASDANFTLRLTYGRVLPYDPADGIHYNYYTTLKGVMEKENPQNPTEFTVPARLKELYAAKDFGRYANERGELPVAFLADCDITGGNSGSPVLNAKGALLGLAFDGNWEAMSGDVAFEPELQRTIAVDVRYVLFVIDKFAGAGWLLDELQFE